ncbi:MAG TPA: LuxR C-terminal-related transcriptional regulator [Candidatus Polarisedimenticolaceae bacterium]|nr:LuxR C-terminal-related transcriptional regulator [Candidatus Polarisedimenticolaceae bacterium]
MRDIAGKTRQIGRPPLTSEGRLLAWVLAAFAAVALLAALDLVSDTREGTTFGHVAAELGVVLVGMAGAVLMARRLVVLARDARVATAEAAALAERLAATEAEAARWRGEARDLLAGLGAALDRQFERWALSGAEKEVALLLLKGLSHREIAGVRNITEATARQQARAVYRKAGLSGRNDLAAFFLEDLLLPGSGRP